MDLPSAFDLRALSVFITVAETGGMTPAAKQLGLKQSTVSQSISSLEEALKVPLFDRSVRPIALTSPGVVLYEHGRTLLHGANEALMAIQKDSEKALSSLTIGMIDSFCETVGPRLVRDMGSVSEYWRVWSGLAHDHWQSLRTRAVDLIIASAPIMPAEPDVDTIPIFTESYVLAFKKGQAPEDTKLQNLSDRPLIRYSLRSSIGRQIEQQINRHRIKFPVAVEFDGAGSQLRAVGDGLGWSLTTPLCLAAHPDTLPKLDIRPLQSARFTRDIFTATRSGDMTALARSVTQNAKNLIETEIFKPLEEHIPWIGDCIWLGRD